MTALMFDAFYEKLKNIKTDNPLCNYSLERCQRLFPLIQEIQDLKQQKNALILAHSYVHPDIIYGVADHTGDSYGLSQIAKDTTSDTIVFSAVRFMAETAKILNPTKTVIDPNPNGGCSLADSIDAKTVLNLREQYPHHTFVCYINTTADVKAACDVCVTSSNAYQILEAINNDKIYFLPDKLMAQNLKNYLIEKKIDKELLFYDGTCYVHEEFESEDIDFQRRLHPNLQVLAHPECKPSVTKKADFISSTTGMFDYVKERRRSSDPFLLLTECGIASRIQAEFSDVHIIGKCMLCKFMKANSLNSIKEALKSPKPSQIIHIDSNVQQRALRSLNAMFKLGRLKK